MGLLYNLEVKVRPAEGPQDHVHLEGGGLEAEQATDQSKLSYSAPNEDGAPAVTGADEPKAGAGKPAQQTRGAFGQQSGNGSTNRADRRSAKKK